MRDFDNFDREVSKSVNGIFKATIGIVIAYLIFWALVIGGVIWLVIWLVGKFVG